MALFDFIFRRRPRIEIPQEHAEPLDRLYVDICVEDIGVYQRYFEKIIEHVDVANYTQCSLSREYDCAKLDSDDEWMHGVLQQANQDGIAGALEMEDE